MHGVPLDQRQAENTLRGFHFAERCASRIHLGGVCVDFHYLGGRTDLQRDVHLRVLIDLERNSPLLVFAKALSFDF